jgi:hypothetical protein
MADIATASQVIVEIAHTLPEADAVSQAIVEVAHTLPESMDVYQVVMEIAFIRSGRYAGPAVQHV